MSTQLKDLYDGISVHATADREHDFLGIVAPAGQAAREIDRRPGLAAFIERHELRAHRHRAQQHVRLAFALLIDRRGGFRREIA